jgi:hypothetical protein
MNAYDPNGLRRCLIPIPIRSSFRRLLLFFLINQQEPTRINSTMTSLTLPSLRYLRLSHAWYHPQAKLNRMPSSRAPNMLPVSFTILNDMGYPQPLRLYYATILLPSDSQMTLQSRNAAKLSICGSTDCANEYDKTNSVLYYIIRSYTGKYCRLYD